MTDRERRPADGEALPAPEDFWLELGPPSAYYGTGAYDRALREGDASPDAERLGWTGAEPGRDGPPHKPEAKK